MTRALSLSFGLLMVAAGALRGDQHALVASAVATVAVIVGLRFAAAATLAVAATVVSMALSDPSPVLTAIAGLAAACYLVLRHAGAETGVTMPTVFGAVGLSAIAVLATVVPSAIPWVPLAAPVAIVVMYVTVVAPLIGWHGTDRSTPRLGGW